MDVKGKDLRVPVVDPSTVVGLWTEVGDSRTTVPDPISDPWRVSNSTSWLQLVLEEPEQYDTGGG